MQRERRSSYQKPYVKIDDVFVPSSTQRIFFQQGLRQLEKTTAHVICCSFLTLKLCVLVAIFALVTL